MPALSNRARTVLKLLARDSELEAGEPWKSVADVEAMLAAQGSSLGEVIAYPERETGAAEQPPAADLLDQLAQLGYLEKRTEPSIQYRRIMKPMAWPIAEVRQIMERGAARCIASGFSEEGVVLVDMTTASLLVSLYDRLGGVNQEKFASRDVVDAANLAWKLVGKGALSVSFASR